MKKLWIGLASLCLISGLGVGTYFAINYVYNDQDPTPKYKIFTSWGEDVFSNKKLTQQEIDLLVDEYKPTSFEGLNEVAQTYEKMFQDSKQQYLEIKFWEGLEDFPSDIEIKARQTTMTESYLDYRFLLFLNASFVYTTFQELNKDLDINHLPDKINSKNQYESFLKLYQAIFNIVDSAASMNNMFNSKQYDNLISQTEPSGQEIYYNRKDNLMLFINSLNKIKFKDVIVNLFNLSMMLLEYAKNNNLDLNLATIEDENELNDILDTDKTQLKTLDFDLNPAVELTSNEPDKIDLKQVNETIANVIVRRIAELNKISWDKIEKDGYNDETIETWGFKKNPIALNIDYEISQVVLNDLGKKQTKWEWDKTFDVTITAKQESEFCEGSRKINFDLKIPTLFF